MPNTLHTKISFEDTSVAFSGKTNRELRRVYRIFALMNNNFLVKTGTFFLKWAFRLKLPIKWAVKPTLFSHFCGGESIQDCDKTIDNLAKFNIGTILDYSVEGEKNEHGFELTMQEIIRTIDKAAANPKKIPFCVFKVTGLAPFDLLEKVQQKQELNENEQKEWNKSRKRVEAICQKAYDRKVRIFIDAEESWIQESIDKLAYEMMETYNTEEAIVYNTYQLYCHATLNNLKNSLSKARENNYFLGAKLVRGAYMEKERDRAKEKNYSDPIQPDKAASDRDFDAALLFCVENIDRIALCAGTHNEDSSYYLTQLMEKYNLSPDDAKVFFAQLFGMSDHISYNLAKAGYNVAKYVPYGPVQAVMPYLFRRAEENTSVAGQSSREFALIKKEIARRRKTANLAPKN